VLCVSTGVSVVVSSFTSSQVGVSSIEVSTGLCSVFISSFGALGATWVCISVGVVFFVSSSTGIHSGYWSVVFCVVSIFSISYKSSVLIDSNVFVSVVFGCCMVGSGGFDKGLYVVVTGACMVTVGFNRSGVVLYGACLLGVG